MKALMMIVCFPPWHTGGAEKQCWEQSQALVARGHEVVILTEWWAWRSRRREDKNGVRILRLGLAMPWVAMARRMHDRLVAWWRLRRWSGADSRQEGGGVGRAPPPPKQKRFRWMAPIEWTGQLSFILEVAWALKTGELKADIVHVHESHWLAGFANWVAEKLGVPIVCTEHSPREALVWPGMRDVPGLSRWQERRLRCWFLSISRRTRRSLEEKGIPPGRIMDVYNGVEIPLQTARVGNQDAVIYLGNFTQGGAHKAFDILLQAWGLVHARQSAARLHLYGAGDAAPWRRYARDAGCGDSVRFEGKTDQVQDKLLCAGIFVLPSRWEGLSCALLEAQAAGLPAVVSDIEGNVEVVENGINGIVVPVGNANALAEALIELIRSPELRVRMGREARKRAESVFAIGKVAEQLEAAYRTAIEAGRS